jgi:hypothetical protein
VPEFQEMTKEQQLAEVNKAIFAVLAEAVLHNRKQKLDPCRPFPSEGDARGVGGRDNIRYILPPP